MFLFASFCILERKRIFFIKKKIKKKKELKHKAFGFAY